MNSGFVGKIKNNRAQIGEGIYLLYFAIMIGVKACGFYEGQIIFNLALAAGVGLIVLKMLITEHSIKEYAVAAIFMLIAGVVYIHTGEKGLIVYFCMMLGIKQVRVLKVVKVGILVSGMIILFKIFTAAFGLIDDIYYPQERPGIGLMFRHGLGYPHPNSLHMSVFLLSVLIIYYVSKRYTAGYVVLASVLTFVFNLFVFQYSGSRTGMLVIVVYLLINLWFYFRKTPGLLEKIVCYISFPGACFIAIIMPFIVPAAIYDTIDQKIFTTRFSLAKYFWEHNSVSLFGIRLNNPDEWLSVYGIDMSQLYLFLQLGILAFVVIAALTMWFIHDSLKKSRMSELAVFMGMLVMGIWEPHMYNLSFKNFVFMFMGVAIYEALRNNEDYSCDQLAVCDDHQVVDLSVLIKGVCLGFAAGICAGMIFYLVTTEPSALYGSRENNESGRSLGMEAVYLTKDDVNELGSKGDIIVGYVDETTPMYKYDSQIALMEYERRGLSAGILTCIVVSCGAVFLLNKKRKKQ